MPADTIPRRFFAWEHEKPDAPAYAVRRDGHWEETSWRSYVQEVRQAARALIALGVRPGDRTAIMGGNRPAWAVFDLATMAVGAAAAGIYTTAAPKQAQYVLGHAGAAVALVDGEDAWRRVAAGL
ncbi:MAG: AMP-binding protein, partial [Rhodothermales bacterium]|nr:AMP-binding protein [Rhodothermales bacterium]